MFSLPKPFAIHLHLPGVVFIVDADVGVIEDSTETCWELLACVLTKEVAVGKILEFMSEMQISTVYYKPNLTLYSLKRV